MVLVWVKVGRGNANEVMSMAAAIDTGNADVWWIDGFETNASLLRRKTGSAGVER